MTPLRSNRCTPSLGLILVLALAAASSRADDLTLVPGAATKVPGNRISGVIQSETPEAVTIKPATGEARVVPVDQIESITYAGQPASLPLAETREAAGNVTEAVEQFDNAAKQAAGKPLIQQAAQFGAARALATQAESEPSVTPRALERLDAFLKSAPTSRFKAPALELTARLALASNDLPRATQALDQLATIPWAAPRAALLKARLLSQQGQHDAALAAIDKVVADLPADSPRLFEARLARSEALAASGKFAESEAAARQVIADAPPEAADIQAPAYNTLGDCLRAAKKPKDALFAYLHTDILYDANKPQHAVALAKIAETWRALDQTTRADEALARLQKLYPNSPAARAARADAKP
jgi:tetratricopeptide (TPR) repeat protein